MRADFGAVPLRASLSLLLEVVLVPEQLRHEAVVRPGGIPLRFHQRGRLGGGQPSRLHEVRVRVSVRVRVRDRVRVGVRVRLTQWKDSARSPTTRRVAETTWMLCAIVGSPSSWHLRSIFFWPSS